MGGSGPTPGGLQVQQPNLDGIEKIDMDALTGEISDKYLAAAFECAMACDIHDIQKGLNARRLCLEIMKGCLATGNNALILQAYGYVLNKFSSYWKEKDVDNNCALNAKWRMSEIQIELVQYFLNIGCANLAVVIAKKIMVDDAKAKAYLKIFLAQKAGTNGGPYR